MARKKKEVVIYKTGFRKGNRWGERESALYKHMECKVCGKMSKVSDSATAVICFLCVQDMVEAPVINQPKVSTGRPMGWHWMKVYVHLDGTVYHKGKEQPELKGTLEPTSITEKKIRITKKQKEKYKWTAAAKIAILKKELKTLKWKKDQKRVLKEIKYFAKIVNGRFPKDFRAKLYS